MSKNDFKSGPTSSLRCPDLEPFGLPKLSLQTGTVPKCAVDWTVRFEQSPCPAVLNDEQNDAHKTAKKKNSGRKCAGKSTQNGKIAKNIKKKIWQKTFQKKSFFLDSRLKFTCWF